LLVRVIVLIKENSLKIFEGFWTAQNLCLGLVEVVLEGSVELRFWLFFSKAVN